MGFPRTAMNGYDSICHSGRIVQPNFTFVQPKFGRVSSNFFLTLPGVCVCGGGGGGGGVEVM